MPLIFCERKAPSVPLQLNDSRFASFGKVDNYSDARRQNLTHIIW